VSATIRIVLVDDHALIRRGVRLTLEECADITVVGEAADYTELRALMREVKADLYLVDVNLPGKNGIDIIKQMREEDASFRSLVLSMFPEDQYAVRAIKAGAFGYLNKASPPEQLIEAVRRVADNKKYITPEIAEALANSVAGDDGELPHTKLSDREFQTLTLMASGKKLSDIAEALALSPKTVSVYRARLLEKMNMSNNAELTHYALKHGLVD
jgi:two-component system, NarL family, invasion response regulator UvrY